MSPFNMELLMKSIANNDQLVRSYHAKCAENSQIQQNYDSIAGTAQQIQQMYTNEKDRKEQLQAENAELITKLKLTETRLETVENERINTDTLNKQTIAELEDKLERSNQKYLELCGSFVEQANILQTNSLSTIPLMRKCTAIKDILQSNGIHFEWKSPSKQRNKSTTDKIKSKSTRTFGTQANIIIKVNSPPKTITCEKSTQYQQSKTTRSTCTSTFIRTVETSTNTDEYFDNNRIETMSEDMVPIPNQSSPIYGIHLGKVTNSTQTMTPNYRTQGTLTAIHNVRKRINYTRARTKSNVFYEVKKEECPSPIPSISNTFAIGSSHNAAIPLTAQFHHIWQMLGELLYRTAQGQVNAPVDEKWTNDVRIVQKFYEIQNLIGEKACHPKAVESSDSDDNSMVNIDCDDDHSRDSIESYNSAKIVISKIRNLSNCSPMPDENAMCSTSEAGQSTFRPIASAEGTEYESEPQIAGSYSSPLSSPSPSQSPTPNDITIANRNHRKEVVQREKSPVTLRKPLKSPTPSRTILNSFSLSEKQVEDDAHFKVPKRRTATSESDLSSKKRKTTKVSESNDRAIHSNKTNMKLHFQTKSEKADILTSLFGDLSDDDDDDEEQVFRILNSMNFAPKMVSPIKDWPDELRIVSPPLLQLDMNELAIATNDSIEQSDIRTLSSEADVNDSEISMDQSKEILRETTEMPLEVPSQGIETEPIQVEQPLDAIQSPEESNSATEAMESSDKEPTDMNNVANVEEICEIDYYSPASPKPDDQVSTVQPPVIPVNTCTIQNELKPEDDVDEQSQVTTNSALDQIIYNYVPSIRYEMMSSNHTFSTAECYLIASLRNTIEKYCLANEWKTATVTDAIDKLFALSRQPKHLATSILEIVEDTKESLSLEFTPPAPALQPSHQKCLVLVAHLTQLIPSFDKYIQFELERKLFTFHPKDKMTTVMTNLAHFYVALIDIEQPSDRSRVRLFIYKCLYYFKGTAVPLVFSVIMAHPYALPHANSVEFISDPLIRAIVSTLSNIIYTEGTRAKHSMRMEMFHTLKRRYGFFMDKLFPTDSIVDYCMDCIRANQLQHVDFALILIAKRQDVEYAVQKILEKHLIPMLHQYFSMNLNINTEHDEKICMILFTIGSIVKTFPIEQNVNGFLHIFVTCLNATQRQIIQEAAVSAICQMSRFGTTQIYPHLASWKPNYTISSHIQAMLRTIVYRKPKPFWFANGKR